MSQNKPNNEQRLAHITKAVDDIFRFTEDMGFNDFIKDEKTQLAVIKLFEIIGEAAYHLTKDFKSRYPFIEWRQMEGLRHVLVHDYYQIDPDILWNTKQVFLINLKHKLEDIEL